MSVFRKKTTTYDKKMVLNTISVLLVIVYTPDIGFHPHSVALKQVVVLIRKSAESQ